MSKNREFDIIVYGASGFTGRLVAEYMQGQYGRSVNWAMAGRSADKLAEVRDLIGADKDTPLVVADASDPASVRAMVARASVICTTVGPYQLYGSDIVAACAELGTDCVDLSGEPGWMHEMIGAHDAAAKASGARIVHSCGFDSIPFDLGVLFLQDAAKEKFGVPCPRVRGRVRAMNGEFSGGTAASLNATMEALGKNPALFQVLANPFSLSNGFQGPDQPDDSKPVEDEVLGQWVAPFIMAAINTKNVHRSNALLGHAYGEDFVYDEMMLTGAGEEGKAMADFVAASNPLVGDDVPKPGEGPSKESREAGNYDILFHGTTAAGDTLSVSVGGDLDPGYGSTSKMIAESAMCLLQDSDGVAGGVLTPAPSMGHKLISRLISNAGLSFKIEG
ncbi:saccharopine dehydrogenase NADP-binding domain-containing protein [Alphaproteobacteria bacterium]|nr:saccharopine dehydrogenase NADP-binding domain-containing protein [Alphaproteobacteria bacterium]MDC0131445.1 saccharopine dehydrogenase NADP-binding domain-containing protein [Alphaproteobacteria bacterium]